jgi:phage terminase large subunit
VLEACTKHRRVAVRSGHKVGKSTSAVILALWRVVCWARARVIMTSSSGRQVEDVLWKEMTRVYNGSKVDLGGRLHKVPGKGLKYSDGREVIGFSTDKQEKMAGFSGPNMLFIVDEASGVDERIFEAIEGNRAGGASIVMFSNPTQTSGSFYDAFHSKSHLWKRFQISSEESPNILAGKVLIPGMAEPEWLAEKLDEWGRNSPLFQVRVLGEFPEQGANVVVPLWLVTQAEERWKGLVAAEKAAAEAGRELPADESTLELGVDPARFGDDESAIAARRGYRAFPIKAFVGLDGVQLAGEVLRVVWALRRPGEVPRVKVDVIGIGASCADQLRYHRDDNGLPEVEVVEVNVAERATTDEHHRLRDQVWFAIPQWLAEGGALPEDGKLSRDLVAPTYSFDTQGRYEVEPKKETKKRLRNSPNRADALGLCIFRGGSAPNIPDDDFDRYLPKPSY